MDSRGYFVSDDSSLVLAAFPQAKYSTFIKNVIHLDLTLLFWLWRSDGISSAFFHTKSIICLGRYRRRCRWLFNRITRCKMATKVIKKICFYGPESTGKSTMAKRMAELYKTEWVPEVAREIVSNNDFTIDDIIKIGHDQTNRILEKTKTANRILFCDTDLITTQIYSRHYLNVIPPILFELEKQTKFDRYFLFEPDVPWVADGMRDLGQNDKRKEMFEVFRTELGKRNINYLPVRGTWEEREKLLKNEVDRLLKKP
jgi:nicotinamide riboside kinase